MDLHKNARLTFIRREQLAQRVLLQGATLKAAAAAFNVSSHTAAKWVRRYQQQGRAGLLDRSSRPTRPPPPIPPHPIQQGGQPPPQPLPRPPLSRPSGRNPGHISRIL